MLFRSGAGGRGGPGGDGGTGGAGGTGGGGGGALEIFADGRIVLEGFSGYNVNGGDGDAGQAGTEGAFGTGGQRGSFGRGNGGDGGSGRRGGSGGDGGNGGAGGGGAGGTVKFYGSVVETTRETVEFLGQPVSSMPFVFAAGEQSPDPAANGQDGRLVIGSNTEGTATFGTELDFTTEPLGESRTDRFAGRRAGNPHVKGMPETPFIPDLQSGAELFGLLEGLSPDDAVFGSLASDGPADSLAAITRLDIGPGTTYDDDFTAFDMLLMMNLTDAALADPLLGIDPGGADASYIAPLRQGGAARGFLTSANDERISALGAGAIYATLVPEGAALVNASVDGLGGGGILDNGETFYVAEAVPAPIPLPAPVFGLISALVGLGAMRLVASRR